MIFRPVQINVFTEVVFCLNITCKPFYLIFTALSNSSFKTSKNDRHFEDLFRAYALLLPVTFLTGNHVYKSDLTRPGFEISERRKRDKNAFTGSSPPGSAVPLPKFLPSLTIPLAAQSRKGLTELEHMHLI